MSQNPENAGGAQHYLKLPENFGIVEPFLTPPAEVSTATDIRFNKYVLCSNLRSLKSAGEREDRSELTTVENEDWRVELFGGIAQFLIDGKDGVKQPCDFMQFFHRILYDLRCPSDKLPDINVWIQSNLATPPQIVQTNQNWVTALQDYQSSFIEDRNGRSTVWFYFQFMGLHADHNGGPSEATIKWITEELLGDPIQVVVSPEHAEPTPAKYDESWEFNVPLEVDPAQEDPASISADTREHTLEPVQPGRKAVSTGIRAPQLTAVATQKGPLPGPSKPVHNAGNTAQPGRKPVSSNTYMSRSSAVIERGPAQSQMTAAPIDTPAVAPNPGSPAAPLPGPARSSQIPSRTKRGTLASKLKKVSVAAGQFKRKVKEGLKSPLEPPRHALSPEPEEKLTILTELASQARDGGVKDPDNLLPCTQLLDQEGFFRYCCGYLPALSPESRDNVRSVRLSNCKLAVTPYQFCMAVKILFKENDTGIGGGFLASAPGIGKTYIVLFTYALRTLLLASRREVEMEWASTDKETTKSKPGKKNHLPRDAQSGRRLRCPSEKPGFGVRCYCVPDGLTRLTVDKLKPGLTLIQVPNGTMPGWLSAIKEAKFDLSVYNIVLFHPAAAMPAGLQTNVGALLALKRGIRVGAILPGDHPGGRIEHQRELDWHIQRPPLTKNHMALESYCLVTTHHSSAIEEEFQYGLNDLDPRPARVTELPDDNKIYAILCGMNFVDESHQVLTPGSKVVRMAQIHRHIRARKTGSDIWHVTATPFGAKFENVLSAVRLLAPELNDVVDALGEAYGLARSSDDPHFHVAFETQFRQVFDDKLVIRDVETTTFLGRPITDIQPVTPKFISNVTPEAHVKSVQAVIDYNLRDLLQDQLSLGGPYVDYLRAIRAAGVTNQLYFMSLFPSMADAMHQHVLPDVVYMDHRLEQLIRGLPDTTGESIAISKVLTDAVESFARRPRSPKVQDILKEIRRMVRDTSSERPDPDKELAKLHGNAATKVDLTLKKMVIITPTLSTAVFLYLYLLRYHHNYNPLLYHQALKASAKAAVLRKFNSLRKEKNPWRVFIAPVHVAGAGLNLQVANRLVITSPLLNKSDEKQALARLNRTGQTLQVHIKILISEDSPIDRIILADRARRAIISDPFNLNEDLITLEPDAGGPAHTEHDLFGISLVPIAPVGTVQGPHAQDYTQDKLYD